MGACSSKPKTRELDGAIEPSKNNATKDSLPEVLNNVSLVKEEEGATASAENPQESRELSVASAVLGDGSAEKEDATDEVKLGEENVNEEASKDTVACEEGGAQVTGMEDASQGEQVNLDKGSGGEGDAEAHASNFIEDKGEAGATIKDQDEEASDVPTVTLVVQDDQSAEPADAVTVLGNASKIKTSGMEDVPSVEPSDVTSLKEGFSVAAETEEPSAGGAIPEAMERDQGPSLELNNIDIVPIEAGTSMEVEEVPSVVPIDDVGVTSRVAPLELVMEATDVSDPPVYNEAGTDVSEIQGSNSMEGGISVKEVEARDGELLAVAVISEGDSSALGSAGSTGEVLQDVKVDEAGGDSTRDTISEEPAADTHADKAAEESIGEAIVEPVDECVPSDDGQPQEIKTDAMAEEAGEPETIPRETDAENTAKSARR